MQRPIVFVVALVAVLIGIAAWSAWPPAASVAPLAAAHEAEGASAVVVAPRAGTREDPTSLARERDVPAAPPALVRIVDEHGTPVAGAEVAFDASAELVAAEAPLPFDVEQRLADAAHVRSGDDFPRAAWAAHAAAAEVLPAQRDEPNSTCECLTLASTSKASMLAVRS